MRHSLVVLGLILLLASSILVGTGCLADSGSWDELGLDVEPICTWSGTQTNPRIENDILVFEDDSHYGGEGYTRIYYYDYVKDEIVGPLRGGGWYDQQAPDVYWRTICYSENRGPTSASGRWIVIHDIDTGDKGYMHPPSPSTVHQYLPRIFDKYVVWYDDRVSSTDTNVYLYDLDSATEYPIDTTSRKQQYPDIDDCRVVYETQLAHPGLSDIAMYDFNGTTPDNGTRYSVCSGNWLAERPSIHGKRVVWQDRRSGTDYDIYMYDLDRDSDDREVPICTHSGDQTYPQIYGDFVVWQDSRTDDAGPGIYLQDLNTLGVDNEICIATVSSAGFPAVFEDRVAFTNGDIYQSLTPCSTHLQVPEDGGDVEVDVPAEGGEGGGGKGFHPLNGHSWKFGEMCYVKSIESDGLWIVDKRGTRQCYKLKAGSSTFSGEYLWADGTCKATLEFHDGTTVKVLPNTYLEIQNISPLSWETIYGMWDRAFNPGDVAAFKKLGAKVRNELSTGDFSPGNLRHDIFLLGKYAGAFYNNFDKEIKLYRNPPDWMLDVRKKLGDLKGSTRKVNNVIAALEICLDVARLLYLEGYLQKVELNAINPYLASIAVDMTKGSNPHGYQCNDHPLPAPDDTLVLETMVVLAATHSSCEGGMTGAPKLQFPWWVKWDETKKGLEHWNFEINYGEKYSTTGDPDVKFSRKGKLDCFLRAEPGGKSLISCVLQPVAKNMCKLVEDAAKYFIPPEVKILLKAADDQKPMADFTLKKGHVKFWDISRAKKRKPNINWRFGSQTSNSRCGLLVWQTKFEADVATDGTVTLNMEEGEAGLSNYVDEDETDKADYWPITWADGTIVIEPGHESEELPIENRIAKPYVISLAPTPYHAVGQNGVTYRIGFSDAMDTDSVKQDGLLELKDSAGATVYSGSIKDLMDAGVLAEEWQGEAAGDDRPMVLLLTHVGSLAADTYTYTLDLTNCYDAASRLMETDQLFTVDFNVVPPIGPDGGTVETPDGVSLDIPAGALSGDEQIEIAPAHREGEFPPSFLMYGYICEFTPHGLTFDVPVKITFPLPEGHPDDVRIFWYDANNDEWEDMGGTVDGDTVYTWITHLSDFGAGFSETDGEHFRPIAVADASPKKLDAGETVVLDGSGSWDHNEGDTLYFQWDTDSDGAYETDWSTDPTYSTSYSTTGIYAATLHVKDDVGLDDVDTVAIWVGVNSIPTARGKADKEEAYEEETITFDASESYDDDGDSLEYRWDWESDGVFDTEWSADPTAETSFASGGTICTITLEVRDPEGETDYDYVMVDIRDERAIRLDSFTATRTRYGVDVCWVTGSEIDTAGFNLWRSDGGQFGKINPRLIEAKGGPAVGARYHYLDRCAAAEAACTYGLEEIETNGQSSFYGPAHVTTAVLNLLPDPKSQDQLEVDLRARNAAVR